MEALMKIWKSRDIEMYFRRYVAKVCYTYTSYFSVTICHKNGANGAFWVIPSNIALNIEMEVG